LMLFPIGSMVQCKIMLEPPEEELHQTQENNGVRGVRTVSSMRTPVICIHFALKDQERAVGSMQTGGLGFEDHSPRNQKELHASERGSRLCYRPTSSGAHRKLIGRTARTPLFSHTHLFCCF
jgi:hypothetical protein